MPKHALTDISVRALKPSDGQVTYWDTGLPNFGVRVGARRKTFIVLVGEQRTRLSLGVYPSTTLAEARKAARLRLIEGVPAKQPNVAPTLFSEGLALYLSIHSKQRHRTRTAHENKRILERHFLPVIGAKKAFGNPTRRHHRSN